MTVIGKAFFDIGHAPRNLAGQRPAPRLRCDLICSEELRANQKCSRFRAKASAWIVAVLFEGEIVRRGQRQCKRGMLRSAAQDDTGEQMNLPCRREAEPHAPRPATQFGLILALA